MLNDFSWNMTGYIPKHCLLYTSILLAAHNLHGGFVGIGIELFGIFIAAVVVEVGRVYILSLIHI